MFLLFFKTNYFRSSKTVVEDQLFAQHLRPYTVTPHRRPQKVTPIFLGSRFERNTKNTHTLSSSRPSKMKTWKQWTTPPPPLLSHVPHPPLTNSRLVSCSLYSKRFKQTRTALLREAPNFSICVRCFSVHSNVLLYFEYTTVFITPAIFLWTSWGIGSVFFQFFFCPVPLSGGENWPWLKLRGSDANGRAKKERHTQSTPSEHPVVFCCCWVVPTLLHYNRSCKLPTFCVRLACPSSLSLKKNPLPPSCFHKFSDRSSRRLGKKKIRYFALLSCTLLQ